MDYILASELVEEANREGTTISEVVMKEQAEDMGISLAECYEKMEENLAAMEASVVHGQKEGLVSVSGLTGGDGLRLMKHVEAGKGVMGPFMDSAVARGIGVAEYNAAMGRIVAAPTAGSCGIMPGALISMMKDRGAEREKVVMSLFTAAALGMIIAKKASIAGASGGCQAECGAAAGMTAAAIVEIQGGTPEQCLEACAIALKNQLGLVCDPVAGLVEIPCIKRNAQGIVTAFCAADMALAGITSRIPLDEVIGAMKQVGDAMAPALKETAAGGLATTPTGLKLKEQVLGN